MKEQCLSVMMILDPPTLRGCSCQVEAAKLQEGGVPRFYSARHAVDAGWQHTADPVFCPPDEEYVWVCPECIARINERAVRATETRHALQQASKVDEDQALRGSVR